MFDKIKEFLRWIFPLKARNPGCAKCKFSKKHLIAMECKASSFETWCYKNGVSVHYHDCSDINHDLQCKKFEPKE